MRLFAHVWQKSNLSLEEGGIREWRAFHTAVSFCFIHLGPVGSTNQAYSSCFILIRLLWSIWAIILNNGNNYYDWEKYRGEQDNFDVSKFILWGSGKVNCYYLGPRYINILLLETEAQNYSWHFSNWITKYIVVFYNQNVALIQHIEYGF